jgi:hypothetical protein
MTNPARAEADAMRRVGATRTPVQKGALVVAAAFTVVGILGFIPGITTNYDSMRLAGADSDAHLFGIFEVSILHNLVHLLFGLAGFAFARTVSGARAYLVGGGAVYLVLWLYGLIVDKESAANFIPINNADSWLHLFLGIGMIAIGLAAPPRRRAADMRTAGDLADVQTSQRYGDTT